MAKQVDTKKFKFPDPTFYVVGGDPHVAHMMRVYGYNQVPRIEEAQTVIWTGGPDIHPMLYGQGVNPKTRASFPRDREDLRALRQVESDQVLVGICRGAQFLNVMVGNGTLYQDVDGHATGRMHEALVVTDSRKIKVTSTHHQMMLPGPGGDVLLRAREAYKFFGESGLKPVREHRNMTDLYDGKGSDVEAVIYWSTMTMMNVLCYQPHPEYMADPEADGNTALFFEFLEKLCLPDHVVQQAVANRATRLPGFIAKRKSLIDARTEQDVSGVSCG